METWVEWAAGRGVRLAVLAPPVLFVIERVCGWVGICVSISLSPDIHMENTQSRSSTQSTQSTHVPQPQPLCGPIDQVDGVQGHREGEVKEGQIVRQLLGRVGRLKNVVVGGGCIER